MVLCSILLLFDKAWIILDRGIHLLDFDSHAQNVMFEQAGLYVPVGLLTAKYCKQ